MMKSKIKNLSVFAGITFLGVVAVLLCGLAFSKLFNISSFSRSGMAGVFVTWATMVPGFCIIPYLILRKAYSVPVSDLGLKKPRRYEPAVVMLIMTAVLIWLMMNRPMFSAALFVSVLLQNLGIAFAEEFFNKGVLFSLGQRITDRKVFVVILCAAVFAFVFHSSDSFYVNLSYRFPMGIILGLIYMRTHSLCLPVTLHLVNNLIATSVFN